MIRTILIFGSFAAMAFSLLTFARGWNPRRDYEKTVRVSVTHCPQCPGYPSSPGVIQNDIACEERMRGVSCTTSYVEEKQGVVGVMSALAKNPSLLFALLFLVAFEIFSVLRAGEANEWELFAMAAVGGLCFAFMMGLFFILKEWVLATACFLLLAAALTSYELQKKRVVQDPAPE